MSIGDDMCNFATFRPATLTVTNFFKQVTHLVVNVTVITLQIILLINLNIFTVNGRRWGTKLVKSFKSKSIKTSPDFIFDLSHM